MGAFLDRPKIEKYNDSGDGQKAHDNFQYALASMQGWRIDMEDAHHIIVSLKDHPPFNNWSFFAVFDGHAGSKVALHSAENLLQTFMDTREFKEVAKEMKEKSVGMSEKTKKLIKEGMRRGFMKLDENMLCLHGDERERSGTTVICALLTPEYIFFANLGDSRGVMSRKNGMYFGTQDHKPYLNAERERIEKAGGAVLNQRVNSSLEVSRALGDFEYKTVPNLPQNEQMVSPEPDVYATKRNLEEDEFLVLACDGIFDVVENNELCELVRSRLAVTPNLTDVANQLLDICLSKGSRDNMTILLVVFDSAPKLDIHAIEAEKQWVMKVLGEIGDIMESLDMVTNPDAEILSKCLKNKESELQHPHAGGIHVARSLIHRVLERKSSTSSSSKTNTDINSLIIEDEDELEARSQLIFTALSRQNSSPPPSTSPQLLPTKIDLPPALIDAAVEGTAAEEAVAAIEKAHMPDSAALRQHKTPTTSQQKSMDGGDSKENNVGENVPATESDAK